MNKTLRTGLFSLAGGASVRIASFISGLVIARAIGPAGYGLFVLVRDLCNTLSLLTTFGLDLGLVRWIAERKDTQDVARGFILFSLFLVFCLSSLVVVAIWSGGSTYLGENLYPKQMGFSRALDAIIVLVILATLSRVLGGGFQGLLRIEHRVTAEQIIQPLSRLIIILSLFLISISIWSVIWGTLFSFFLALLYFIVQSRGILFGSGLTIKWPTLSKTTGLLKYSFLMSLALSIGMLLEKADILMLGYFGTSSDIGSYAIVQMAVSVIVMINSAFNQRLAPRIAELAKNGARQESCLLLSQHIRWMALATVPMFVALSVFGADLLRIFGSDYQIDWPVVVLLSSSQFIVAVIGSCGYLLSMTSAYKKELPILLIALTLNVSLNYLWIPLYGLSGAAGATVTATLIANLLRMMLVIRLYEFQPISRRVLAPLVIAVFVVLPVYSLRYYLNDTSVAGAFVASSVFSLIYAILVIRICLNRDEKVVVNNIIRRLRG